MRLLHTQSQSHVDSSSSVHPAVSAQRRVCRYAHPGSSTVNSSSVNSSNSGLSESYSGTLGSLHRFHQHMHSFRTSAACPFGNSPCCISRRISRNNCSSSMYRKTSSSSRSRRVAAAAAAADQQQPDLSALRKGSDLERLLFAQMAQVGAFCTGHSSAG